MLTQRLIDWRNELAAAFKPKSALPDSERNRIAARYTPVLAPLAQALRAAVGELDSIVADHRASEAATIKEIAAAVQDLAVAEAHVRAMGRI